MAVQVFSTTGSVRFGFHASRAGAIYNAPLEAAAEGCGAFQVFAANSRSWKSATLPKDDAALFREYVESSGLVPFAHVPYLCNPSSSDEQVRRNSVEMLADNLGRCNDLGIHDLVVHMGSHKGAGIEAGMERAARTLGDAIDLAGKCDSFILLENGSGYTNSVGSKIEEIGDIIRKVGSGKVGLCLDTCHAFAAGYELRTANGIASLMDAIDAHIGLERLHLVHFNDSKYGFGSKLDRHWNIGKGHIGRQGLGLFLRNEMVPKGCFIMETPITVDGNHESDLRTAESLAREAKLRIIKGKPLP